VRDEKREVRISGAAKVNNASYDLLTWPDVSFSCLIPFAIIPSNEDGEWSPLVGAARPNDQSLAALE
jgi:hypothetical protein